VVPPAPVCRFDTHVVLMFNGRIIESITAKGRLWNFEANGTPWASNGSLLETYPAFQGACSGQPAGACVLETRAFALYGSKLMEFITARGQSWALDNGAATDNGSLIGQTRRYQAACAPAAGGLCKIDTRAFVNLNGRRIETLTAYGRIYSYDDEGRGAADNGSDLFAVPRYAAGPCLGQAPGACKFDTRTYGLVDGRTAEIVTANGKFWRWLPDANHAEVLPNGQPLISVPHWANGPCR